MGTDKHQAQRPSHRRSSFVGRERELRELQTTFEAATLGHGALVMLVGEPGIGKTALCHELAHYVEAHGGLALVGHCYPAGSASVPYQPFVEALESLVRQRNVRTARGEGSSGLEAIARIVPSIRDRLRIELAAQDDPEVDRLRLVNGLIDYLRHVGATQPLLLVLEDLHDADRGTLDVLVYLARYIADTPLLVVGTYRDVAVDRAHPLAAALVELRRVSQFERTRLSELSVDEVQRLLSTTSKHAVPRPLAEVVHRRSGGNPLFTHELLRFLLSERLVEEQEGVLHRVGDTSLAGQMPEGLRDVVGKRLSRLSRAANQVLGIASVIGREFELDVLRRVYAKPEDELESAIEEAVSATVIEERLVIGRSITYRFSHAFFQQTLYDEILAPRRIRLHQQIARVLEEFHARRLEDHATELAEHYSFSSDANDLSKAVNYATLAARRATDVFAYGEAARQLERALALQDLVDPDDRVTRCDRSLALGEALFLAGESVPVFMQVVADALALAESLGDRVRAFSACRLGADCLIGRRGPLAASEPEYLAWAERATEYAEPDSIERSLAHVALGWARFSRGEFQQARALRLEALALARRHGDPEALFTSARPLISWGAPQHWGERALLAEECTRWPRTGVRSRILGLVLWDCALVQLSQGERSRAEELWRQVRELAERTHVPTATLLVNHVDVILAVVDGHLEEALTLVRRFVDAHDASGMGVLGRWIGVQILLTPALYLGRPAIWLGAFDEYAVPASLARMGLSQAEPGRPGSYFINLTAARALCLAQLGRVEEARTLVGPLLDAVDSSDEELIIESLTLLLQAAVVLEHRAAAQALAARLACVAHLTTADSDVYTCIARHLGDAAALCGNLTAARGYYLRALEAAVKIRFRPEIALTHLHLAELLLADADDGARAEALEHLDLAIPELRDMHMQPAVDRAQALSDAHRASPQPATARASGSDTLTARELEVVELIAAGLSNHEIAQKLVITHATVEVHVKHILSKLGYRSRSQAAVWFVHQQDGTSGPSIA